MFETVNPSLLRESNIRRRTVHAQILTNSAHIHVYTHTEVRIILHVVCKHYGSCGVQGTSIVSNSPVGFKGESSPHAIIIMTLIYKYDY